jgi:glycosyltransferase involved in cell wall biosynthesis
MEKPWLSVIIPSHNRERWLGAALQSLVEQTASGMEVIVIDASATDGCLRLASSYSNKLNIRAQRCPDLVSRPEKANFGVAQARADYICVLDDDDLWLPKKSARVREWLAIQPDGVMQLHPCYVVDGSGRRLGLWRCPLPDNQAPVPTALLLERLLVQNFIATPSPIILRDAFLKVSGLDNQLWFTADWDLYFKVAAVGPVYYHACALACYRVHNRSLTAGGNRDLNDFRNQYEIVMHRYIEKLPPARAARIRPIAEASIEVNTALAAAVSGRFFLLTKALAAMVRLGPRGIHLYFVYSRIVERSLPRLRALLADRFGHA